MASPITTGGFSIQAQPNINFLPPSAFSSGAADIIPNMSQGVQFAQQLQQIRDEAVARPILQRIQQLKAEDAQARLNQIPMEQKMQRLALLQKLEQPVFTGEEVTGGAYDAGGRPFGGSGVIKTGFTRGENLEKIPFERLVIQDTDEERNIKFKAAQQQALRDEAYAASLNARAADLGNPDGDWSKRTTGVMEQGGNLFVQEYNTKTGELRTRDTGLKPTKSQLDSIEDLAMKKWGGAGAAPIGATPNLATGAKPMFSLPGLGSATAPEDTPAMDDETQALIDALSGAGETVKPVTFKNADEVKSAVKAGTLGRNQAMKILREQFGFKD